MEIPSIPSFISSPLIVASIDIGIATSGLAYSMHSDFEKDPLKIIAYCRKTTYSFSFKEPTFVLIEPDGQTLHSFGYEAEDKYEDLVVKGACKDWYFFKSFKLLLFNRLDLNSNVWLEDSEGKRLLAKTVYTLAIRHFKDELFDYLKTRIVNIKIDDLHWVLTIPDTWNDQAEKFVAEAAEDAGIRKQRLILVSESQAVAVYYTYQLESWKSWKNDDNLRLHLRTYTEKKGSKYIILNAEESIVYLTVHEIIGHNKARVLHKSTIDGGSLKVNDAFEDLLGTLFGKTVTSELKEHYEKDWICIFHDFETQMRRDHVIKRYSYIHIPISLRDLVEEMTGNTLEQCIEKSCYRDSLEIKVDKLKITAEVMRSIFNNAVTNINSHIEMLLESPIMYEYSAIVMVGYFSESQLLKALIQEKFNKLKVIVFKEPQFAVLKGAVSYGHNPQALVIERTERNIPLEILQTDKKSIEFYKEALAEGTEAIQNIRVMIVGHFGVGKTTLTKRLLGQDVEIDYRESTDGIDVHVKRCKVDIKSGNWIIRQKGDESESVYRRLASILKRKHAVYNATRKPSSEMDTTEIQTMSKSASFQAPVQQNTATNSTEKDNPGFLTRLFRKMKLKKSSRTILSRQQQKETEQENLTKSNEDAYFEATTESNEEAYFEATTESNEEAYFEETTKSNEEAYFEDLVKELQQLPLEDSSNTADLSIWDFAGQYCFYDTHQVFLSRRTIFLLVTDLSKTLEDTVQDDACYPDSTGKVKWKILDFVEFWLKSIHEFCSHPENTGGKNAEDLHSSERCKPIFGPPVILVGTFADKLNQDDRKLEVETYFSRLRECLVEKNVHVAASHLIENDFAIDNTLETEASGIDSLKKQILETAKLQSYWGEHVPARWTTLENVILNLKSEGLKVLSIQHLVELNSRLPAPLQNDKEIETFLTFHHDCGNIIYYRNEEDLKENIILSPQWLVDAFKCLITAESFCRKFPKIHKKWIDFNRTAVFDRELIGEIWENKEESDFKDHKDLLLNYLERLGLIARQILHLQHMPHKDGCSLLEEEQIKDDNLLYLAPCILKNGPPEDLIENATKKKTTSKLCFTTASRFLPTAVFNKLLAACIQLFPISHHKNQYHIYCGCGVFDVPNGHEMVVFFHDNVIQMWLLKYSIDDKEPHNNTCIEQRQFVTNFLKRHLTTLKIYVKCPQDSAYSDYMFDIKDLLNQEEVACGCQGEEKHAVATRELTKYWFDSKQSTGEIPCYKMDQKPRGWCIIINIEKFAKRSTCSTRTGTEYDKDRLMDVFRHLHFNVDCRDNLTSTEIMRYLVHFSYNVDHSSFDCFVCCILSHGSLGHVYGSDGKLVPIKDMTSVFKANQCPSLAGKPKLFFMQACQGPERMPGVAVAADIEPDAYQEETIPLEADFLIGYSTVPGYVSYRQTDAGSWYIRLLCEVLMEYKDRCHLLEILTEVNRRVAKESTAGEGGVHKQIPAPQTTLRKKVYFR